MSDSSAHGAREARSRGATGARRAAALRALAERADAMLVTGASNVRYLTGFTGSNGQLLLASDPVFFTDGRYGEQSQAEVPDIPRAVYAGDGLHPLLSRALADRGASRLGFEAGNVTVEAQSRMASALKDVELVALTDVVEGVRARKSAAEVDAVRRAQRVTEQAVLNVLAEWKRGTEAELALALEWAIRTAGAEAVSFDVIVASGPHAALPHAKPRDVPIEEDAVLLIDVGARVDGYCSDMTRTFLRSGEELRDAHAAVVRALEAGCEAVRPGVRAVDVDKAARDVLEAEGLGKLFVHSTGHGVGLEIHEAPRLSSESKDVLEEGMVVTVEPGVYLAGVGGVRVEDLIVVRADGAENLTSLARSASWPG